MRKLVARRSKLVSSIALSEGAPTSGCCRFGRYVECAPSRQIPQRVGVGSFATRPASSRSTARSDRHAAGLVLDRLMPCFELIGWNVRELNLRPLGDANAHMGSESDCSAPCAPSPWSR
jgi:hypothetical protein